jgi:hypothetical protein
LAKALRLVDVGREHLRQFPDRALVMADTEQTLCEFFTER